MNSFENMQALSLMQVLIGAISTNFRAIAIVSNEKDKKVTILFYLEQDLDDDIEEIDDIVFEFEAMQEGYIDVDFETIITKSDLILPVSKVRMIYRKKEK